MKHRKEEDDLYRKFQRQREEEESKFKEEFRVRFLVIPSGWRERKRESFSYHFFD